MARGFLGAWVTVGSVVFFLVCVVGVGELPGVMGCSDSPVIKGCLAAWLLVWGLTAGRAVESIRCYERWMKDHPWER